MIGTQASLMFSSKLNSDSDSNSNTFYSMFISLLFSSVLVSIITQFTNQFYIPDLLHFQEYLEYYCTHGCYLCFLIS